MVREQAFDDLDIKIIKRLLRNSRTSFAKIAKECNVSTLTIKNRYNRLKKTGIIKGSTVIATEEHIHGGECIGDLCITVDSKKINQFIEYVNILFKNKCPVLPVKFNQEYNVAVMVLAKNIQEIQETKDKLGQHADVIRIRVAIWTAIRNTPQNLDPKPL